MVAADEQTRNIETKLKIFISHSREDLVFVNSLETALKARDIEVLMDRAYSFEEWSNRIQALIGRADTVVFVLSPDSITSKLALRQVEYAASLNKRFAPIVCRRVDDRAVPEALRRLNFIFFDDPTCFGTSVDALVDALRTDIGWIRQQTDYGEAARRWSMAGRPRGLLLHSPTLEMAERWFISRPHGAPEPTLEISEYIGASLKGAATKRHQRRAVRLSIFALPILALMIGVTAILGRWINPDFDFLSTQRRWYTTTRPYAAAKIWPYVLTVEKERGLKPGDSFKECATDCPDMIVVPAGSFTMGSPPLEKGRWDNREEPRHTVTIHGQFALSKYEVTFADWDACVAGGGCDGYKPLDNGWGRGRRPVIHVSWDDAKAYVAWLSMLTGKQYRLVTEAEYEYATRAGTTTAYPWGDDIKLRGTTMANCNGCGSKWDKRQTAPVGSFAPNKFGLYDMVGNVNEWVEDCYHLPRWVTLGGSIVDGHYKEQGYYAGYIGAPTDGSAWVESSDAPASDSKCSGDAILRGGSWQRLPEFLRSASRIANVTGHRNGEIGFRVGRTLLPSAISAPPISAPLIAVTPLSAERERALKPRETFAECTRCPEMIVVPAGSFMMGSPASELGRSSLSEDPQHQVTLGQQFAVGRFELTFEEWDACVADGGCNGQKLDDEGWGRGRQPVIHVSWNDATAYVAWLAKITGKQYRLLSESEYEYATRAGTQTAYPWGNDIGTNNAYCRGCGSQWGDEPAPVGSFPPNKFGLYDMVGNVEEWTQDCWHYSYNGAPTDGSAWTGGDCSRHVYRGGAWRSDPVMVRSAERGGSLSDNDTQYRDVGFRVARTLLAP